METLGSDELGGDARSGWLRRWWPDLVGLAWVIGAAAAVMIPALVHGTSLGPIGSLSKTGLSLLPRSSDNRVISDQLTLFVPWTNLAWTQVHNGQLPMWNPYSVLGMPLAFNWESAPFGLPALVGYLVPVNFAYTVGVLTSFRGRNRGVRAGPGPRSHHRGLCHGRHDLRTQRPVHGHIGVVARFGPVLGRLAVRPSHTGRQGSPSVDADIFLLAVVIALMVYAGYPEGVIILGVALGVFLVVLLGFRMFRPGKWGPIRRPLGDIVVAAIAGAGLSLPLALPGLQVAAGSSRNGKIGVSTQTLGSHFLKNLIIQGFDGQKGGVYFGPHTDGSTVIYLGVIAAVLAILAVVIRWRQPMVVAFAVLSVVMVVLAFFAPLASVIDHLPEVGSVRLYDALGPLALAVAVLAGIGTDILVRSHGERRVQWCAGAGFVAAGLVLLGIWVFSRGHLQPVEAVVRNKSFIWPAVETLVGLAVVGAIVFAHRRARQSRDHAGGSWPDVGWLAAAVLLICETVFLVGTGVPTFSSSPAPLKPTPDDILLRQAVGSSVVGLGETCSHIQTLGILLNINVSLQVQEFGVYDPTVPYKYVTAWDALAGKRSAGRGNESNVFCPRVGTAREARRFGIGFVLEHHGAPGPRGAVFDRHIGNQDLYRIPGAAPATLTPMATNDQFPASNARGTPVSVTHPDPASWKIMTHASTTQALRLRLTDTPGWQGTIDGRPLALSSYSGILIQAKIPPGRHTIELHYWPDSFTFGIVLAFITFVLLVVAVVVEGVRRRRRAGAG